MGVTSHLMGWNTTVPYKVKAVQSPSIWGWSPWTKYVFFPIKACLKMSMIFALNAMKFHMQYIYIYTYIHHYTIFIIKYHYIPLGTIVFTNIYHYIILSHDTTINFLMLQRPRWHLLHFRQQNHGTQGKQLGQLAPSQPKWPPQPTSIRANHVDFLGHTNHSGSSFGVSWSWSSWKLYMKFNAGSLVVVATRHSCCKPPPFLMCVTPPDLIKFWGHYVTPEVYLVGNFNFNPSEKSTMSVGIIIPCSSLTIIQICVYIYMYVKHKKQTYKWHISKKVIPSNMNNFITLW